MAELRWREGLAPLALEFAILAAARSGEARRASRKEIDLGRRPRFSLTFRDWAAEASDNSFPREVCEHALANSLRDRVEAAYQRGDLFVKRIALMQAWADYCGSGAQPPLPGVAASSLDQIPLSR